MKPLLVVPLLFLCICTRAQTADTIKPHSPQKAALFSAILPGSGQIYNKKWWKAPIVWAGIGTATAFIMINGSAYHTYRDEYLARLEGDTLNPELAEWSVDGLRTATDTYQRWRDLSVATFAIIYVLNIIDAAVDAHLFTFDVSDDLSLQLTPFTVPSAHTISGLTLTLKL